MTVNHEAARMGTSDLSTRPSRRANRPVALALIAGACVGLGAPAAASWAQDATAPATDAAIAGSHVVRTVRITYAREHPSQPSVEAVLLGTIGLVETPEGLSPPDGKKATRVVRLGDLGTLPDPRFSDRGLAAIPQAVSLRLRDLGLIGVYVTPDPAEFALVDGRVQDRRPAGSDTLTLVVSTGVVTEVRTVAQGERVFKDLTINNALHAWIRDQSPVQPMTGEGAGRRDLLRGDLVNDYVFKLSRHPGRRVDVTVDAPGTEPGAARVDYVVTENRPWLLFAQLSNTGTPSTDRLREHFGFIHNNLTNRDDVFALGYHTANFSDSHTVYGSYEFPNRRGGDWRFRLSGSWYQYEASEVGFTGTDFEGDGFSVGAEAIWNFFQDRDFFLDLVFGFDFKHVSVDNNLAAISGDDNFVVPHVRLRAQRHRETSRLDAEGGVEFNIPGLAGTDSNLDALGRTAADEDWFLFKGNAQYSFYLEPGVARGGEPTKLAHELAFSAQGQLALDSRLIPNETFVAGGLYTVRGYPEAVTSGDTAIVGTAEYRWHVVRSLAPDPDPGRVFGRAFRFVPQYELGPTDWDLQLKLFGDVGRVTQTDRRSFEVDHTLVAVGVGTELSFTRHFNLRLDWGVALNELLDSTGAEIVERGDNRLSFVLTAVY